MKIREEEVCLYRFILDSYNDTINIGVRQGEPDEVESVLYILKDDDRP